MSLRIPIPRRCRSCASATIRCAARSACCCAFSSVSSVASDVNCRATSPSAASTVWLYSASAMSAFATSPPSFAFSRLRSKIGSDSAGPIEPPSASCLNSDAGVSANSPPSAARFTSG
ncbi:rND efflux system, outer membrane lipoprotein, NodT family [Burkholderia pseudomallei]|nr:rND efflux system, outer membrane lipoprotein, NodT family [Burkholderia pseudomallei]KGS71679.1 RND efflux system, outer membrane lipo, NodT family domain protein [Burkholderia pseudomallei MSHR4868]KOT25603.1 rND efflux system, outer membrane lipoprotein, NodT family [Burkholderia mallei]